VTNDELFSAARRGDRRAFAEWMGRVERPVRDALRPYARAVDVEGVVQETLLRMWVFAQDDARSLEGENASLRFAIGVARNVARNEARRFAREVHAPDGVLPDVAVADAPPNDPALRRAIEDCLRAVAPRPHAALEARIERSPYEDDRRIAASIGMTLNTFFQNDARARRQLAECLERRGVAVGEWGS
jgi:DNA-directed RNA polymerase specialized sigma24 family protein